MDYVIAHTWDGKEIPADHRVKIRLEKADDGDDLVIKIDAPFHNDPAPPDSKKPGDVFNLWDYEGTDLARKFSCPVTRSFQGFMTFI